MSPYALLLFIFVLAWLAGTVQEVFMTYKNIEGFKDAWNNSVGRRHEIIYSYIIKIIFLFLGFCVVYVIADVFSKSF